MLGLFKLMNSDTITIQGNGTKVTLSKVGALVVFDIVSDRRVTDAEISEAFPAHEDAVPATPLDNGSHIRSRASWPLPV